MDDEPATVRHDHWPNLAAQENQLIGDSFSKRAETPLLQSVEGNDSTSDIMAFSNAQGDQEALKMY